MSGFESLAIAFQKGGIFMYFIGIVGIFVIAISADKLIKLFYVYSIDATPFMNQIIKLVQSNNVDRAIKACQIKDRAMLPQVIKSGLMKYGKPIEDIQGAIDEASLKAVPAVQSGLNFIATFANLSTLLGLLGTITGLIISFGSLSYADPSQKQQLLAKGIAEAMHCTAFGLMVAVLAIVFHAYLSNKANKIMDDVDRYSVTVINTIYDQYRPVRNKNMPNVPPEPPFGKNPKEGPPQM
ncbi:MAG: MotA/TolQ/ExbB proton channel family protein [Pseudomonadota bacterium]